MHDQGGCHATTVIDFYSFQEFGCFRYLHGTFPHKRSELIIAFFLLSPSYARTQYKFSIPLCANHIPEGNARNPAVLVRPNLTFGWRQ
jgi:hypothetical protein